MQHDENSGTKTPGMLTPSKSLLSAHKGQFAPNMKRTMVFRLTSLAPFPVSFPIAILGLSFMLSLSACRPGTGRADHPGERVDLSQSDTMQLVASFYPLAEIARAVTGPFAQVRTLVPPGVEPHDYEPAPQDIRQVREADVLVLLGDHLEPLTERILAEAGGPPRLELAKDLELIHEDTESAHSHGRRSGPAQPDPHVWLSPRRMALMTEAAGDGLAAMDTLRGEFFRENAKVYADSLRELDTAYQVGLKGCEKDAVLATHQAYNYLARDYGFEVIALGGMSHAHEPSPGDIRRLIDTARRLGLRHVLREASTNERLASAIAQEIGGVDLEFDPAVGSAEGPTNYLVTMRNNLIVLRRALECP